MPIVVEEQFLALFDVSCRVECHLDPSLRQNILREQIFLAIVAVIDKPRRISHEPRIDGPLGGAKIIESIIDTQTLPQDIDAVIDQLPTVDHQKLVPPHRLASEQPQTGLADRRPPHPHPLELSTQNGMVPAALFETLAEATRTDERIALRATVKTGTFVSPALRFFTIAAALPNGTMIAAHALRKTVFSLSTGTRFTVVVDRRIPSKVVRAGRDSGIVLGVCDADPFLALSHRLRHAPFLDLPLPGQKLGL